MPLLDDQCLDLWIRQRDTKSFSELVSKHGGMVYGVALRITNDPHLSIDIATRCFKGLAELGTLPSIPIVVYLHREVTKLSVSAVKSNPFPLEQPNVIGWNELRQKIDVLIANLTEKLSQPLILHFLEGQDPVNLVSILHLPREKIEEMINRGVEHLRRGLSLMQIHLSSTQLAQLLSANAFEPCPARLNDEVNKILVEFTQTESPSSIIRNEQRRKAMQVGISLGVGLCLAMILILVVITYQFFIENNSNSAVLVELKNMGEEQEITTSNENVGENMDIKKSTFTSQVEGEGDGEKVTRVNFNVSIDINSKLFEMVFSRYETRRKGYVPVFYNSQSLHPLDAFYYYLLALETLPSVDIQWLQQMWNVVLQVGGTPIPNDVFQLLSMCQESFQHWRSGVSLARGSIPQPVLPDVSSVSLSLFQTFFELFTINALVSARQPNEMLLQDVFNLSQFCENVYPLSYGEVLHIPLHAMEAMGIIIREFSRLKVIPPEQYRTMFEILSNNEKMLLNERIIKFNEYKQISIWIENEFPTISDVRDGLRELMNNENEKAWLERLTEQDLKDKWDYFLRLPPDYEAIGNDSLDNFPLEKLRKVIFATNKSSEEHRKHVMQTFALTRIFLGIEWFAEDNGDYPLSLEELIPNYLPEANIDRRIWEIIQYYSDGVTYQVQSSTGLFIFFPWHYDYGY